MTSPHHGVIGGACLLDGGLIGTAIDTLKMTGLQESSEQR